MSNYNPFDHYWKHREGGMVFSSRREREIPETDGEYQKWLSEENTPTLYPTRSGVEDVAALDEVLSPYGLRASPVTPEERRSAQAITFAEAVLMPVLLKQTAEMAELTDEQLITAGESGYFDVWEADKTYAAGKRLIHKDIVYIVQQNLTAQAHQPPDGTGMLAVYKPIHVGGGENQDGSIEHPFDLVAGMAGTVGLYYRYGGSVWKCLREMANVLENWLPGMPGMESFWKRIG